MKITLISPYHGGSHSAWAEGYQRHSRHDITLLTLPARFWKWRMHGGAVTLANAFLAADDNPDLILATDMLDLTTFLAIARRNCENTAAVLYMHENQLTYPLPADGSTGPMRRQLGERDQHYAFINYASQLAADRILFNSNYHMESYFAALPNFLKHFPENNELATIEQLRAKSQVLPVGIAFNRFGAPPEALLAPHDDAPLIIWNQRWEYDKNPAAFFKALFSLKDQGVRFRLALCGQQFGRRPPIFDKAIRRLSEEIIHVGMADEDTYRSLLWTADITVSTAVHEFFGISILEAIKCHTFPILPRRLSYPELLPESFHRICLYDSQQGLVERLRWALANAQEAAEVGRRLASSAVAYDWSSVALQYDRTLSETALFGVR